jgi:hypothetical protein
MGQFRNGPDSLARQSDVEDVLQGATIKNLPSLCDLFFEIR